MKTQKGNISIRRNSWFYRWYESGKPRSKVGRAVTSDDRKNRDRKGPEGIRIPEDVREEMNAVLELVNGPRPVSALLTITEMVDNKYFPDVEKVLRPQSLANYRSIWNLHLKPRIGSRHVSTFEQCDAFLLFQAIQKDHPTFCERTMKQIRVLVWTVFQWAMNRGFYKGQNNPGLADLPEGLRESEETEAYSIEEVKLLLSKCIDSKLAAVLALLFGSGNRVSEVRGLTWENYDRHEDGATLRIRQQYTRHGVQPLKTKKSKGDIYLGEFFCGYIDAYRAALPAGSDSGFMFTGRYPDKPMHMPWFAESKIKPLLQACKIPYRHGFHAFRRGNSTFLGLNGGSQGVEMAAAQNRNSKEIQNQHYQKMNDQQRRQIQAAEIASLESRLDELKRAAANRLNVGMTQ